MEQVIAEQVNGMIINVLGIIITAVISYVGIAIKTAYTKKAAVLRAEGKNTMLLQTIDTIVASVEEEFKGEKGQAKYDAAFKLATDYSATKNLNLSGSEISILINAAVLGLREAGVKTALTAGE